MQPSTLILFFC